MFHSSALLRMSALLALGAGCCAAQAVLVEASVQLRESGLPPVVSGSQSAVGRSTNGDPISGQAGFGTGSAGFELAPRLRQAGFGGFSAAETFAEFNELQRETQLQAFVNIEDHFHIDGPVGPDSRAFLVLRASGTLIPALDFEHTYTQLRGDATVTANAQVSYSLEQRPSAGALPVATSTERVSQVGSWLGAGNPCAPVACIIGTGVDVSFVVPLALGQGARDFSFQFLVAANGFRGGGFDFGAAPAPRAEAGLAATSPFSFELQLSPGLTFSADGGYYLDAVPLTPVPEPPSPCLWLAATLAAGGWLRRRRMA